MTTPALPTKIQELTAKAATSTPPIDRRIKWDHLMPVVDELRMKGFTVRECVEWLKGEGQVPHGSELRALNAFTTILCRRRKNTPPAP
jgi:hypothetical protein